MHTVEQKTQKRERNGDISVILCFFGRCSLLGEYDSFNNACVSVRRLDNFTRAKCVKGSRLSQSVGEGKRLLSTKTYDGEK